jgi:hypothetical protein
MIPFDSDDARMLIQMLRLTIYGKRTDLEKFHCFFSFQSSNND